MPLGWHFIRPALGRAVLRAGLVILVIGFPVTLFHPETPLPDQWNPTTPLDARAPVTVLTRWKLSRTLADDAACVRALDKVADFTSLAPLEESDQRHIRPRLALRAVGRAQMAELETRCQTALRLAMWERHGLQAAALRHLGQPVAVVGHFSSYSCRGISRPGGESGRMSKHATANAIDVSGFRLADGQALTLQRDWDGDGPRAAFLRDAHKSACRWFPAVLGPGYNRLHADHFHLQTTGWELCR